MQGSRNIIVESTLAGRSIGRVLERARTNGFWCQIAFTFVDAPEASIARIVQRVRAGGHHVPDEDVNRRFYRSIRNFWLSYRNMVDQWTLTDNRLYSQCEIAIGDSNASRIIDRKAMQEFLDIVERGHV